MEYTLCPAALSLNVSLSQNQVHKTIINAEISNKPLIVITNLCMHSPFPLLANNQCHYLETDYKQALLNCGRHPSQSLFPGMACFCSSFLYSVDKMGIDELGIEPLAISWPVSVVLLKRICYKHFANQVVNSREFSS